MFSLCEPVRVPQVAGTGVPPLMMNWSDWHWLSVVSGWLSTMLSMSSLSWHTSSVHLLMVSLQELTLL